MDIKNNLSNRGQNSKTSNSILRNNNSNRNLSKLNNSSMPQKKESFLKKIGNLLLGSDGALLFTLIGGLLIIGIVGLKLVETSVPPFRQKVISEGFGFALAIFFVIVIFKSMGKKVTIFGKSFDYGMIIYLFIIVVCVTILSG